MSILSKAAISLKLCVRILKIISNLCRITYNDNLHCAAKIELPWLTVAQAIKTCIVIGLQRCTVAGYGSKFLYLVTISQFYAR